MNSFILVNLVCILGFLLGVTSTNPSLFEKKDFVKVVLQCIYQNDGLKQKYVEFKDYQIADNADNYSDMQPIRIFLEMHKTNPLSKDEIFTPFNTKHISYAKALIELFMAAKDLDTFYKTAFWARFNVNRELFVYAIYVTLANRNDMKNIEPPPIYAVLPYYFFEPKLIQKAQALKIQEYKKSQQSDDPIDISFGVGLGYNYTGDQGNNEHRVSYFREDIGLNDFYYKFNLAMPFWTSGFTGFPFFNRHRGSSYLMLHEYLLARFNMERLSNDLPGVEELDLDSDNIPGFDPKLRYYSKINFPDRDNNMKLNHSERDHNIDLLNLYEERIYSALYSQHAIRQNGQVFPLKYVSLGTEMLGNMLEGTSDSPDNQFYGSLDHVLRTIINEASLEDTVGDKLPGVLLHYQTSIRDPLFFNMFKYILRFYWLFMDSFPPYTKEQLEVGDIKVTSVELSKLETTFFDPVVSDITNGISVEFRDEKNRERNCNLLGIRILASSSRLNHEPFNFKIVLSSPKAQRARVKVMIGPKYDINGKAIEINKNRKNFYRLDSFYVNLVEGENVITRNSTDFSGWTKDPRHPNTHDSTKMSSDDDIKLPRNLMLPKGKIEGMPVQIFFHVTRDEGVTISLKPPAPGVDPTPLSIITQSLAYPFNRKIDEKNWYTKSMYYLDANIYHTYEIDEL